MIEIVRNIYWTGVKDWELRSFHGHELSAHRGSTYNSYLIKDEKTVLVDTVWNPYKEVFTQKLERSVGLNNIDLIVVNHAEPDHSGSLGHIMEQMPDVPVYCTKNGADIIKRYFHKDWDFRIVKTGDTLKTGEYELVFVEMQMLHWPDSMLTYVKGANTALTSDAFGQHYATSPLFNDEVDEGELYQEALKYYANILSPFGSLLLRKIEQIKALQLPIDIIAPSHGVIWRKNPLQIIDKYYEWASNYNEGTAVIVYDTMYNSTKSMAEAIGKGLAEKGVSCKLFNSSVTDLSDLLTEIFKAKGVIIGSSTVNNTVLRSVAGLLDEVRGHKFKDKVGAAFGSYGWSGEGYKIIGEHLEKSGIGIVQDPIGFRYRPDESELLQCVKFGSDFAEKMKRQRT